MEMLKELGLILSPHKIKAIDLLDVKRHKTSKINEFYFKLLKNEFKTEEEAISFFYGELSSKAKTSYSKLKNALKEKMINTLFFIDVKKGSYVNRQVAYYKCYKDWAAVNILLGKNAYKSCVKLCKSILKYSQQFEFTQLVRDASKVLRLYYGAQIGDRKNYQEYRALYQKYDDICRWEDLAELYYTDLVIEHVNVKSYDDHLYAQAQQHIQELSAPLSEINSYRLQLYYYLILLVMHSMRNEFAAIMEVGEQMANVFKQKTYSADTPLQIAYYYQLVASTQLQLFDEGKQVAEKCISLLQEGSFNWFKYYELFFILAMHTQEYEEAFAVFVKVNGHARMKFMPPNVKEIWGIYNAYLFYLLEIGALKVKESEKKTTFRLGRFLNETPIFSKDKRGANISILIVQILISIQQKKYNLAIDKIEAIEKYCSRYLFQAETIRSYYFIKMLLCVPLSNFNKVAVERKSADLLAKLQQIPTQDSNQTYKIEIIPYEQLWNVLLRSLSKGD